MIYSDEGHPFGVNQPSPDVGFFVYIPKNKNGVCFIAADLRESYGHVRFLRSILQKALPSGTQKKRDEGSGVTVRRLSGCHILIPWHTEVVLLPHSKVFWLNKLKCQINKFLKMDPRTWWNLKSFKVYHITNVYPSRWWDQLFLIFASPKIGKDWKNMFS